MKITTSFNGKRYYTISEAYRTFKNNLIGDVPYTTFYKKFVKYKKEHNIDGVKYNALRFYSEIEVEDFIRIYQFITNYNSTHSVKK